MLVISAARGSSGPCLRAPRKAVATLQPLEGSSSFSGTPHMIVAPTEAPIGSPPKTRAVMGVCGFQIYFCWLDSIPLADERVRRHARSQRGAQWQRIGNGGRRISQAGTLREP